MDEYSIVGNSYISEGFQLNLSGVILPNQTFVLAYNNSSEQLLEKSQILYNELTFEGVSSISLVYKDEVLDKLGDEGIPTPLLEIDINRLRDPEYANSISLAIESIIGLGLRRDELIQEGNPEFQKQSLLADWVISSGNDIEHIGQHTSACFNQVIFFKESTGYGTIHKYITESLADWDIYDIIGIQPGEMLETTRIAADFVHAGTPVALPWNDPFNGGPGHRLASPNDLEINPNSTFDFGADLTEIEIPTVKAAICDAEIEILEIFAYDLAILDFRPDFIVSGTRGELVYGINDCPLIDTEQEYYDSKLNVYPTIIKPSDSKIYFKSEFIPENIFFIRNYKLSTKTPASIYSR